MADSIRPADVFKPKHVRPLSRENGSKNKDAFRDKLSQVKQEGEQESGKRGAEQDYRKESDPAPETDEDIEAAGLGRNINVVT